MLLMACRALAITFGFAWKAIPNPASEIITLAGMAVEMKLTVAEWKKIVFPHPTVAEIFREAL